MDDFDRSFTYFENISSLTSFRGGSASPNINNNTTGSHSGEDAAFDVSFETTADARTNFSATFSQETTADVVFHEEEASVNAFRKSSDNNDDKQLVDVRIHEQVSALYDDFSQDGSIAVTGTIYIQTTRQSFILNLKNVMYVQRFEEVEDRCKLSPADDAMGAGSTCNGSTRELKVDLPLGTDANTEIPVANFYCIAKARPVPLLIKRKINVGQGFVRVGFKVRTNPHNKSSLQSIYIVMAVPPNVEGEKCKMSIKGGSWNEMKRTLTWLVKELAPGKALEVQAQFPTVPDDSSALFTDPKFPILVKGIYNGLYSELTVESLDANCDIQVRSTGCLLHRKV